MKVLIPTGDNVNKHFERVKALFAAEADVNKHVKVLEVQELM